MTAVRRVSNILISLIEIMMGLLIILLPEFALPAVITLTGLSFIARGIQSLYFYFSLGRSMVGGRAALYRGLLYLDLGLFTCTFALSNIYYTVLYITGVTLFSGLVDMLRAAEAAKGHSPSWVFPLVNGITYIVLGVAVIITGFAGQSVILAMYVYGGGLIYAAIVRIVTSLRKTAIVYIQ